MSAPELQLKLSPRARKDFRSILDDTGRTWGEQQVLVYRHRHHAIEVFRILHKRMSLPLHV